MFHSIGANRDTCWQFIDPLFTIFLYPWWSMPSGSDWQLNMLGGVNVNGIAMPVPATLTRYPSGFFVAVGAGETLSVDAVVLEIPTGMIPA